MNIKEDTIRIYKRLKEEDHLFPYRRCKIAVIAMSRIGYGIVQGEVRLDNYCSVGIERILPHFWNYDPNSGEEVDITSEQFENDLKGGGLPEKLVWSPGKRPEIYKEIKRDLEAHQVF